MAVSAASIMVEVGADLSRFNREIARMQSTLSSAGQKMRRTGMAMTAGITAPLGAAGAAALKTAGDFESSMNRVQALTQASSSQFKDLRSQARSLGETTQFSASQAADGMGFLAQAGFETREIMGAMPNVLNLAAAGQMDLARTADIASNIMTGFGIEAEESGRAVDVLAATASSANTDVTMMGESMKMVAPVARGVGFEFERTAAAVGLLGNAGIQGSQAGTMLRGAIARLTDPSKKAAQELRELGLEVSDFKDADGNLLPLNQILSKLESSGASAANVMTIFGRRAGPGIQALLDQGVGALEKLRSKLKQSGGRAEEMAKTQMRGLFGALKELKSAAEGLAIAVADSGLMSWATSMVKRFTALTRSLSDLSPEVLGFAAKVAGIAAAIGPALMVLGQLTSMLAPLVGLLNPVTAAMGLLTAAVATQTEAWGGVQKLIEGDVMGAFEDFEKTFSKLWKVMRRIGRRILRAMEQTFEAIASVVLDSIEQIAREVEPALDAIAGFWEKHGENIMQFLRRIWAIIVDAVGTAIESLGDVIAIGLDIIAGDWEGVWTGAKDLFGGIWNAIVRISWTAVQGIIDAIEGLINTIPGVNVEFDGLQKKIKSSMEAAQVSTTGNTSAMSQDMQATGTSAFDMSGAVSSALGSVSSAFSTASTDVSTETGKMQKSMKDVATEMGTTSGASLDMKKSVDVSAKAMSADLRGIPEDIEKVGSGFDTAQKLVDDTTRKMGSLVRGFTRVVGADASTINKHIGTVQDMFGSEGLVGTMQSAFGENGIAGKLLGTLQKNVGGAVGKVSNLLSASGPWGAAISAGLGVLKMFGIDANDIFSGIVSAARSMASAVKSIWNGIKGIFGGGDGGRGTGGEAPGQRRDPSDQASDATGGERGTGGVRGLFAEFDLPSVQKDTVIEVVRNAVQRGDTRGEVRSRLFGIQGLPTELGSRMSSFVDEVLSVIADQVPGFRSGVTNFAGGLARVHEGELLANLAPGTDVLSRTRARRLTGTGGRRMRPIELQVTQKIGRREVSEIFRIGVQELRRRGVDLDV